MPPSHSVAVLGNGPSYLRHHWGPKIDACDEVIRMNLYRLRPEFDPHVGRRVTVWSMYHDPVRYNLPREIWWVEFGGFDMSKGRRAVQEWCDERGVKFERIGDDAVQAGFDALEIAAANRWSIATPEGVKPSSGIVTLQYAMQRWPESTIYVAGLDGFNENEPKYYWDDILVSPKTVRVHVPERQRLYIATLLGTGRVKEFSDDE